jgi:hypothetical protein
MLSHFLPADLFAELCVSIVDTVSEETISLDALFDTRSPDKPSALGIWTLVPKVVSQPMEIYLQDLVRTLAWQSDNEVSWFPRDFNQNQASFIATVEGALRISRGDLATIDCSFGAVPQQLHSFAAAVEKLKKGAPVESCKSIAAAAALSIAMPLSVVVVKHLGDLCADADRWDAAVEFYSQADLMLPQKFGPVWREFLLSLKVIISQSVATALRITRGPVEASLHSEEIVSNANLQVGLLASVNTSPDLFYTKRQSSGLSFQPDMRALVLLPPQLIDVHKPNIALECWANRNYIDAQRWFWSVLRRQIALGSARSTRYTKAYYGRCLIDSLTAKRDDGAGVEVFSLGVRLLLESGLPAVVEHTIWSEDIVGAHVSEDLIAAAIVSVDRAHGAVHERTLVLLGIFKNWIQVLPQDASVAVRSMLQFIARTAKNFEWSLRGEQNVSGSSFEALTEIGKARPEFRTIAADAVVDSIVTRMGDNHFQLVRDALGTANAYLDILEKFQLRNVVVATLSALARYKSGDGPWPVIQPALTLLSSESVVLLNAQDVDLRSEVTGVLLRFSIESEAENGRLLYLLRGIDPMLVKDQVDSDRLETIVTGLRKKAHQNSSAAVEQIMALLVAPTITGVAGIRDAIDALLLILDSASVAKPRISFSMAFRPVLLLADRRLSLAAELSISDSELDSMIRPLGAALLRMWYKAYDVPAIFAGFAIPSRSTPNPTVVHNWTFASIGFAHSFDLTKEMEAAIAGAARNPVLETPISIARAIRITAGDREPFDLSSIRAEKKEAFYAALGQRLVLLSAMSRDASWNIVTVLFEQCLRFGPKGLDAGIFGLALTVGIHNDMKSAEAVSYCLRLDNDRELRLSLTPMIESFRRPRGGASM